MMNFWKKNIAADGFDPSTSGLWAQHASTAPRCSPPLNCVWFIIKSKEKNKGWKKKLHWMKKKEAPNKGLEPLTLRLKVWCSTDWANRALVMMNAPQEELTETIVPSLKSSLRAGFEPAREIPIGFQVQRLNHSAIAAICVNQWGCSSVVERSLCMWEVRGSIPRISSFYQRENKKKRRFIQIAFLKIMAVVGFEPTPP